MDIKNSRKKSKSLLKSKSLCAILRVLMVLFLYAGSFQGVIAQSNMREITGKVIDESGEVIIGAVIKTSGSTIGTITNSDGSFSLKVSSNATLSISYLGYLTKKVTVGEKNYYEIVLTQKTPFFIVTAVKTSNLTPNMLGTRTIVGIRISYKLETFLFAIVPTSALGLGFHQVDR